MAFINKEMDSEKLLITALGSFIGIGILAFLSVEQGYPLLIASFGATAVLIYAIPESPLARPKNVFFGHLISALVGVACSILLGHTWYSMAIAVTLAIVLMTVTGTLHPPGGATALICVMYSVSPDFILAPLMVGVVAMIVVAYCMNRTRRYLDERKEKISVGTGSDTI